MDELSSIKELPDVDVGTAPRFVSPVLSSLPWYTDAIPKLKRFSGRVGSFTPFEHFIQHIDKRDNSLYGFSGCSYDDAELQRILGITVVSGAASEASSVGHVVVPTIPPASLSTLTKGKAANSVCHLYAVYRLVDELASREQALETSPPFPLPRTHLPSKERFDYLKKLACWPDVLREFRTAMTPAAAASVVPLHVDPRYRILHYLKSTQSTVVRNVMLTNMLVAAMHIAHLKTKTFDGSGPDLPKTVQGLLLLECDESQEPADTDRFVSWYAGSIRRDSGKTADLTSTVSSSFRHPLHLCLCISPLFLLLPASLGKVHVSQLDILKCAAALGNEKDKLLLRCERLILDAVITLSEGLMDPLELARNLCDQLPWVEIESGDFDESWFDLDSSLSAQGQLPPSEPSQSGIEPVPSPRSSTPNLRDQSQQDLHGEHGIGDGNNASTSAERPFEGMTLNGGPIQSGAVRTPVSGDEGHRVSAGVDDAMLTNQDTRGADKVGPARGDDAMDTTPSVPFDRDALSVSNDRVGGDDRASSPPAMDGDANTMSNLPSFTSGKVGPVNGVRDGVDMDVDNPAPPNEGRSEDGRTTGDDDANMDEEETDSTAKDKHPSTNQMTSPGVPSRSTNMAETSETEGEGAGQDDNADTQPKRNFPRVKVPPPSSQLPGPTTDKRKRNPKRTPNRKRTKLSSKFVRPSDDDELEGSSSEEKKFRATTVPIGLLQAFGSHDPIDVDALLKTIPLDALRYLPDEPSNLKSICAPKTSMGGPVVLYKPDGEEYVFNPAMHDAKDIKSFASFIRAIKADYVDDKPRFLSRPDESNLKIIQYDAYLKMSVAHMQGLLARYQCLVITGMPVENVAFDEAGLATLRPLRHTIEITDLSEPADDDGFSRIRRAHVSQLLEAARHDTGKALNALDLPLDTASLQPYAIYASELCAWKQTTGSPGFRSQSLPTSHMRWGLLTTSDAWTKSHIEPNGVCTGLDTKTGAKIWIFERDTREQWLNPRATFPDCLDQAKPRQYPIEAIVLQPGTRLIMRPSVLHAVYTPENTMCIGEHFYATSTMQQTLAGSMHAFVAHYAITNTNHIPLSLVLRRMSYFYYLGLVLDDIPAPDSDHLPDLKSIDGVLNLLSLCWLVIMGNVIDPRTYSIPNQCLASLELLEQDEQADQRLFEHDLNDISVEERLNMSFARGVCLSLIDWLDAHYVVKDVNAPFAEHTSFPAQFIASETAKFLSCARLGAGKKLRPLGDAEVFAVTRQIDNVMECSSMVDAWKMHRTHTRMQRFDFGVKAEKKAAMVIHRRENPLTFEPFEDFSVTGTTPFDRKRLGATKFTSFAESSVDA